MSGAKEARRRVLTVLTFDPWPVRSGITRRLDALVRALDAATELTILVLDVPRDGAEQAPQLQGQVVYVGRDPSRARSVVEVLKGMPRLRPVVASFYVRPELRKAVEAVVERAQPHVVVTHGVGGLELVHGLVEPKRVVLDADTIDPATFRRIARDTQGLERVQWAVDALLLSRWHRRQLPRLGAVTVVSGGDVQLYRELAPGARIRQVPNGVHLPSTTCSGRSDGPLLFVGAMHYAPNASAVRWLVDVLLPAVPDLSLQVVGEGPVPAHQRVRAMGFVPEMRDVWQRSCALAVPLRAGGGTRLKVLEAMANGLPIISTELGMEGLGAVPGKHYLLADTVDEFAGMVRRLRGDTVLRERLSLSGRALAEQFDWTSCVGPLLALVKEL